MTHLAIELADSEEKAKERADFYYQAGCKVDPIFSVKTVAFIPLSGKPKLYGDEEGDDKVWVVQVYK